MDEKQIAALRYIAGGSPWKEKLGAESIVIEYEEVAKAALRGDYKEPATPAQAEGA
jgi:hypothetical protein